MADRVKHPPAPDGEHWVDIRITGTADDAEEWFKLLRYVAELKFDSDPKAARKDGHVRRYTRARLINQEPTHG